MWFRWHPVGPERPTCTDIPAIAYIEVGRLLGVGEIYTSHPACGGPLYTWDLDKPIQPALPTDWVKESGL
jgi:hypothetical protein